MAEQTQTAPPTQADPKTTATNIAKGIQNKANGKAPAQPELPLDDKKVAETPVDPNAGKEKYVVDGKEVWLTPQERSVWIQKGMAFEPRMDELARIKQETIQLQRALINDPLTVLKNIAQTQNIPLQKLYEKVLEGDWPDEVKEIVGKKFYENAVEPMRLTPEQLKAREDAKWRQQREENDKRSAEEQIRRENQMRYETALNHLRAQIGEALQESGLPNIDTPLGAEMATMVAKVMQLADRERRPMTPKQAIDIVKNQRFKAMQQAFYEALDEDALAAQLGEGIVGKIQKYLLKKAQSGDPKPPIVSKKSPFRSGERENIITPDDMHDYLDKLKRQG